MSNSVNLDDVNCTFEEER